MVADPPISELDLAELASLNIISWWQDFSHKCQQQQQHQQQQQQQQQQQHWLKSTPPINF